MNIDDGFVHMIFYDMIMSDKRLIRAYTLFRGTLIKQGYYQLQESIYVSYYREKEQINKVEQKLILIAPDSSNVRLLALTKTQFEKMTIISGEFTTAEIVLKKNNGIIEF